MATTRDIDRVVRTYIDPQAHDITFNATPWVKRCEAKAKKRASMGTYMEYPLEVAGGQAGTYNDLQEIDRQRVNIMDKAYFYPKNYYAQMTVSWQDMKTCRGAEDVVGLLDVKAKNAQKTLGNTLSTDSLTGSTNPTLVGLNSLIYAGASNTVGGHASTEYTGWKNQYTPIGGTLTIPDIITFSMTCSDGNDVPTVLLTDKFIVSYIWGNLLQQQERYSGEYNMAKDLPAVAGFPMIWDAALESSGTGGLLYFINEDYFGWDILSSDNMKYWPYAKADKQFAFSCQWTLQVIQRVTNRMRQGVLYGITTT